MTVTVLTNEETLYRKIRLLLPEEEFTFTEEGAELTIADADSLSSLPQVRPMLVISRTQRTVEEGVTLLLRPFDIFTFAAVCRQEALKPAAPCLTPTEERLYSLLLAANGQPIAREELMRALWGDAGDDDKLNLYVHYLRKKLEADGKKRIFSARGRGYFYKC